MANSKLEPIRHTNQDFFACNIFDALPFFKDDMASMEHPLFSLSTRADHRTLYYENNGNSIKIIPTSLGLATIHDKDILLYCMSRLRAAIADGEEPNKTIRFTAYDFFVSTNKGTSGVYYKNFETSLNRLRGTTIETNVTTGGKRIAKGFGIIDSWETIKRDKDKRAVAIEVTLSDWLYNAVLSNELLTINPDYFRIRQPTERRIYEIARKHCGDKKEFRISLDKLHKKLGTRAHIDKIRFKLKAITDSDHLPDYSIKITKNDVVIFTNRKALKQETTYQEPLPTEAFEKARKAAPGLDIYAVEDEYKQWSADKEPPRNRTAAFIGFCKRKAREIGLS